MGAGTIAGSQEGQTRCGHPGNDIRWHPSSLDAQSPIAVGRRTAFSVARPSGSTGVAARLSARSYRRGCGPACAGQVGSGGVLPARRRQPAARPVRRSRVPPPATGPNIRRVGHLTRLLADSGVVALAALVSPLKSDREIARQLNDRQSCPSSRVYIAAAAECERPGSPRARAGAHPGSLRGFTGVDAPTSRRMMRSRSRHRNCHLSRNWWPRCFEALKRAQA